MTLGAKPSMTKFGSPWLEQFPKSRVPAYARQRGPMQTDVVVVGGGLTGCMTAYAFAAAGVKVVLVEAEQIGRGSSGAVNGWIAEEPGIALVALQKLIGPRDAKRVWQMWRRAALDCAALLRRLDVKCQLEPCGTVTVARHARGDCKTEGRAEGTARRRHRRAAVDACARPKRSRTLGRHRNSSEGWRDPRSLSRVSRARRGGRSTRRPGVRADSGEEDHVHAQGRDRRHQQREYPSQPRRGRDRRPDRAFQGADSSLLAADHVLRRSPIRFPRSCASSWDGARECCAIPRIPFTSSAGSTTA